MALTNQHGWMDNVELWELPYISRERQPTSPPVCDTLPSNVLLLQIGQRGEKKNKK